jgi:hypothetical protein
MLTQSIKKIVVIGPESTGKSALCAQLSAHYQTLWCPEYAREYLLANGIKYTYEDLLTIAKGQIQMEEDFYLQIKKDANLQSLEKACATSVLAAETATSKLKAAADECRRLERELENVCIDTSRLKMQLQTQTARADEATAMWREAEADVRQCRHAMQLDADRLQVLFRRALCACVYCCFFPANTMLCSDCVCMFWLLTMGCFLQALEEQARDFPEQLRRERAAAG